MRQAAMNDVSLVNAIDSRVGSESYLERGVAVVLMQPAPEVNWVAIGFRNVVVRIGRRRKKRVIVCEAKGCGSFLQRGGSDWWCGGDAG